MATHKIASGSTPKGATAWQQYPTGNGVSLYVDTSAAKFSTTPVYITSLGGDTNHWATTGATSIYAETATGFTVFVRWIDGNSLTPAQANSYHWHINWMGMEI